MAMSVSALEKCGVDREKRRQSLRRDATGEKARRVLLQFRRRIARRMGFREMRINRCRWHRCIDRDYLLIVVGKFRQVFQ